ncbi:hypothetical protein AOC36_06465 [Erysipelothrix larvae]|uniref:Uncharacterized protein n=1 Tax=Erysipelothrix larvae TaxID=1514105 RepID=A0A0X8H071_9FIRM|nr:hypothetical protein [Erysipelothrix larvae]AMC93641.1 hypothetical protein AOC36_06465 [Erysipelothrix larvae]
MNYVSLLTDEETKYIWGKIPKQVRIDYSKRNSKQFSKIFRGFRPESIDKISPDLIIRNKSNSFIATFIDQIISIWINDIETELTPNTEKSEKEFISFIRVLPESIFSDNIPLFFKLYDSKTEITNDQIEFITHAITISKGHLDEIKKLQRLNDSNRIEEEKLNKKIEVSFKSEKNLKEKNNELLIEIGRIEKEKKELLKLEDEIILKEKINAELREKTNDLENIICQYEEKLRQLINGTRTLKYPIGFDKNKIQLIIKRKQQESNVPLVPVDMEEFSDYLLDNFRNILLSDDRDLERLLIHHLTKILFLGKPIVLNRVPGSLLVKCISNALVGHQDIQMLNYSNGIGSNEIETFLNLDGRIKCLVDFIGNYNETELFSILENNKNKIIFLMVTYDKTLNYVPFEFLNTVEYLNVNRFSQLSACISLTANSSQVNEVENIFSQEKQERKTTKVITEIITELYNNKGFAMIQCNHISNEEDLCGKLAFSILPYSVDVANISPFNESERLVKYAGFTGNCYIRKQLMEWFLL